MDTPLSTPDFTLDAQGVFHAAHGYVPSNLDGAPLVDFGLGGGVGGVRPYYDANGIRIFHADSLEVLAGMTEQVSAIITDPPYCSGANEAAKRGKRAAMTPESVNERPTIELDAMGSQGFDWVMRRWLLWARKATKDGGHLACFIDWRMLPPLSTLVEAAGWRWNNVLVWDKGYPGLGAGFRAQHEMVILASNGSPEWHSYEWGNVLKDMRLTKTEHPHQKPTGLIWKILATCTKPGEIVLDPFMGSGSTLVAAKEAGRRAIGIDLSEKHCESAARRLSQGVLFGGEGLEREGETASGEDPREGHNIVLSNAELDK